MNAATKQAAWLFCVLIGLACSGWYFASSHPTFKLDDKTLAKTADSVVTGLTVRQFNEKGVLINFLESPEMRHIPEQDTHFFISPHIVLNQENQPSWDIRSKKALSLNKGEQITFSKNVVIHQNKSTRMEASTFKTEELVYFPKRKFATTPLPVLFEQPGSIVHSTGMNAYLEEKRVKLLGKVHATYEPNYGKANRFSQNANNPDSQGLSASRELPHSKNPSEKRRDVVHSIQGEAYTGSKHG